MWQKKLKRISREKFIYGESNNPGVNNYEMERYLLECEKQDIYIPLEYRQILKLFNGLEYDGCILYGIGGIFLESPPNESVYDIIERNQIWHENVFNKKYIYLGESNLSWYTYNLNNQHYYVLDMPSGEIIRKNENLNVILDYFFDEAIQ